MTRWACGGVLVLVAATAVQVRAERCALIKVRVVPVPNALGGGGALDRPAHHPGDRVAADPKVRVVLPADPGAKVDRHGDPLPPGAVARYGTVRLRHGPQPTGLAFGPDGKVLGSASDTADGLRAWDPETGKELARLNHPVRLGAFARDGSVVFVGEDNRARVWSPGRGVRDLPEGALPEETRGVAVHPDGGSFAAGAGTGSKVVLIDLRAGKRLRELNCPEGAVATRLVYSPDGRWLAGAGGKGVWLWDLRTFKRVRTYHIESEAPEFAFSPDGTRIAVTGEQLHVYPTDSEEPVDGYAAPDGPFLCPRFTRDGKWVYALTGDGNVVRVGAATGEPEPLKKPEGAALRPPFALAPDGVRAAGVDESGGIVVWDPATGKGPEVRRLPGFTAAGFSADGRTVSALAADGRLHSFGAGSGAPGKVVELPAPNEAAVSWDPATRRAAAVFAGDTWEVRVIDPDAGKEVGRFAPKQADGPLPGVAFCPTDPDRVAVFSPGAVVVRSVAGGRAVRTLPVGRAEDPPARGAVSPDGRLVATTRPVAVWEVATGRKRFDLDGLAGAAGAAFSPDGRYLAVWDGGTVAVFDLRAGAVHRRLQGTGTDGSAVAVVFSPDGGRVAVGEDVGSVAVWDLATGDEVARFEGQDGVAAVAWSPDGARLASASPDGTVLVWDATRKAAPKPAAAPVGGFAEAVRLLGEADPAAAQRGMEYLYRRPAEAPKEVADRVPAPAAAPPGRIAKLVADLADEDFAVRTAAVKGLAGVGGEAGPAVRAVAEKGQNPEARKLAADVLWQITSAPPTADDLRAQRAVEVLEGLGSADARGVLGKWAAGPPGHRVVVDAAAALGRLKVRGN